MKIKNKAWRKRERELRLELAQAIAEYENFYRRFPDAQSMGKPRPKTK